MSTSQCLGTEPQNDNKLIITLLKHGWVFTMIYPERENVGLSTREPSVGKALMHDKHDFTIENRKKSGRFWYSLSWLQIFVARLNYGSKSQVSDEQRIRVSLAENSMLSLLSGH